MPILMVIIKFVYIVIFIILLYGDGIIFTIMDDIRILICLIVFLFSYIYSISNKNTNKPYLRTILIIASGIAGLVERENGIEECEKNKKEKLTIILGIRAFIIIFSKLISVINNQ